MKRALIKPDKCQNCQPCEIEKDCPMQAVFRESMMEKPWIDFYRCSGCLHCKMVCPNKAIEEISHPCDGKGRMGW
jgi:MinD superfamily P-loop ATPase